MAYYWKLKEMAYPTPLWALAFLLLLQLILSPLQVYSSPQSGNIDPLPLWELRVAATAARIPHYIGSDEYKNYFLPLPYLIYRGDFFQADKDNIRTIFFKKGNFETDLSLWGNPPVPSDNRARTGMNDLDALAEIGPAVRYYFQRSTREDALYLKGAVRMAFSTGWESGPEIDFQGLHGSLNLVLKDSSFFEDRKIKFHLSSGIHFANSRFNSYFYEVGTPDVMPGREYYAADGGYSGFSLSGSMTHELYPGITFSGYGKWDNSSGASYADSPLARTENNYTVGTMLIFTLLQSKTTMSRYSK